MKNLFKVVCLAAAFIAVPIMVPTETVSAEYNVKPGDAFWKIAKNHDMTLTDLIHLNPHVKNPNRINPGDKMVVRTGDTISDIIDYAQALKEVTVYQYGGQDAPLLTDCSGWVQAIYKEFGVKLPRVSRDQARVGTPIKFQNMKAGDLMFFSTASDKTITHVGIFMGEDYWISNLNSKKGVQVMSTWGPWAQNYFMWAQRVI
jgi:cell wall-associated NlpC family hydrolase